MEVDDVVDDVVVGRVSPQAESMSAQITGIPIEYLAVRTDDTGPNRNVLCTLKVYLSNFREPCVKVTWLF